jgi:hypothetical protein
MIVCWYEYASDAFAGTFRDSRMWPLPGNDDLIDVLTRRIAPLTDHGMPLESVHLLRGIAWFRRS